MGPALEYLVDALDVEAGVLQTKLGTTGGDQFDAEPGEATGQLGGHLLVVVLDRNEGGTRARQPITGAKLSFGEGVLEIRVQPHDLTGRLHLWA